MFLLIKCDDNLSDVLNERPKKDKYSARVTFRMCYVSYDPN